MKEKSTFLNDRINEINIDEPFKGLFCQGMVCHKTYQDENGKWVFPEEVKNENGEVDSYDTTGGLPATLRYPNTALDDSMDFLVIRISDFVPAGLNLSGLVAVDDNDAGTAPAEEFGTNKQTIYYAYIIFKAKDFTGGLGL